MTFAPLTNPNPCQDREGSRKGFVANTLQKKLRECIQISNLLMQAQVKLRLSSVAELSHFLRRSVAVFRFFCLQRRSKQSKAMKLCCYSLEPVKYKEGQGPLSSPYILFITKNWAFFICHFVSDFLPKFCPFSISCVGGTLHNKRPAKSKLWCPNEST